MILKANFHMHTVEDPKDKIVAKYTIYEAIDRAKELGFNVLALTCHGELVWDENYRNYAEQKNILLIPGIEAFIENRHVIILNCNKNAEKIKNFRDLENYKNNHPEIFIMAPHPYVLDPQSLRKKLIQNINLFDAIELSIFSNKIFNFNKKAAKVAQKYNKPLIATSDTHYLKELKRSFALVEAEEKNIKSVIKALKENKIENKINSLSIFEMAAYKTKALFKFLTSLFRPTLLPRNLNWRKEQMEELNK